MSTGERQVSQYNSLEEDDAPLAVVHIDGQLVDDATADVEIADGQVSVTITADTDDVDLAGRDLLRADLSARNLPEREI